MIYLIVWCYVIEPFLPCTIRSTITHVQISLSSLINCTISRTLLHLIMSFPFQLICMGEKRREWGKDEFSRFNHVTEPYIFNSSERPSFSDASKACCRKTWFSDSRLDRFNSNLKIIKSWYTLDNDHRGACVTKPWRNTFQWYLEVSSFSGVILQLL